MSASARDRAVEAAAEAIYELQRDNDHGDPEYDWPNIDGAYDWDGDHDEHGNPEGKSPEWLRDRYRTDARAALAAALPVLLDELAQRIEAEYAIARREYDQSRNPYHEGYCDALDIAEQRVRGFAAEVTQ